MRLALCALLLCAAPAAAADRAAVEAEVRAVFSRMKALRDSSPFTEPRPREELEKVVDDPSLCRGREADKYCRVYAAALKDRPGLTASDVFAAFTAEEIMAHGLLQRVTGCTGDIRVFSKLARERGLEFQRVGAVVVEDYAAACYEGGRRLKRRKKGSHVNGHAAAAVRWGGRWRVLDTSAYEEPRYARSGGPSGPELAGDSPKGLLGQEVWFGNENDPYLITEVGGGHDAYTYRDIMEGSSAGCAYPAAARKDRPCRFDGLTRFDDGVSLDFACGRCFIHRDNMTGVDIATGTVCSVSRHETNGLGSIKDCLCVSCPGKVLSFYGAQCPRP